MSYVGSAAGLGVFLVHALLAHVAQEGGHRGLVVEAVEPKLPVEADGQVDGDRLLAFLPVAGPECAFVPSYRMFNGRLRSDPALWSSSGRQIPSIAGDCRNLILLLCFAASVL